MHTDKTLTPHCFEKWRVIVLDRKWVVVGDVEETHDYLIVSRGFFVEKWGTTRGIGQLATDGPTETTVLYPLPLTKIPRAKPLAVLVANADVWSTWQG